MIARRTFLQGLGALAVAARGARAATIDDSRAPFAFALIGDLPYNALEARMLERVYASFDADLAFAVHVGDIKGGWERCDDTLLGARLRLLEASPVPIVYVPGDNEWADCGAARAGKFDPNERLQWLRTHHFRHLPPARGPFAALERQSDREADGLPENRRWRLHGIRFATLNVPGSNNGLKSDGLTVDDWRRRAALNARWLHETYAAATTDGDVAVVIIAHADPGFGERRAAGTRTDGYEGFRALLLESSDAFAGTTLFLHGDSHRHRVDAITPKLLRVESYGSPFAHQWVRIDVDPRGRQPFRVSSRRIPLPGAEP